MGREVKVCDQSDLAPGEGMMTQVDGHPIAVFNVNGEFRAIDGECTHEGGPLGDGDVEGDTVTCPWHGAQFDVTSGEVLTLPATRGVDAYEVTVSEDGAVAVVLP